MIRLMAFVVEDSEMDILWLLAGIAFFGGSWGLVGIFGRLRAED